MRRWVGRAVLYVVAMVGFAPAQLFAVTTSTVASGTWNSPVVWDNGVPIPGDTAIITSGTSVTLDVASASVGNLTVAGTATLDLDGNDLAVTGNLDGAGTIDLESSVFVAGTLSLEGNNTAFSGTITPSYDLTLSGGNAQSILGTNYNALTVLKTNGTTATLAGNANATILTVTSGTLSDGGFTLSSSGTIDLGASGTLRIAATMPAGTHITDPASTVYYDGDGNQTISTAVLYGNLYLTTGSIAAVKSPDGPSTLYAQKLDVTNGSAAVTLDIGSGSLDVDGDITGNGNLSNSGGTVYIGGNMSLTGTWDTTASLVIYDGTSAQNVRGTAYHDLVFNSGGTASLTGNASVANLLDVNTGTLAFGTNTVTVSGNVEVDSGTIAAGTSTLVMNGAAAQAFTGTAAGLTLHNLQITGGGGVSFGSYDITVGNTLTLAGADLTATAPKKLILTTTSAINRTAGGVRGTLAWQMPAASMRRFETSSGGSGTYSPIEITTTNAATLEVEVNDDSATNSVDRVWKIAGVAATTLDLKYFWSFTGYTGDTRGFVPVVTSDGGTTYTFPAGYVDTTGPGYFASVTGVSNYNGEWSAGYAQFFGSTTPSLANFSPTFGAAGTAVSLFGSNLTAMTSAAFNGTTADVFSVLSDNEISTEVPALATTGTITVSDGTSNATSFANFTVVTPTTIQTAQSGNWSSPSTWQGGAVPNSWDTVIVNHPVTLDVNVTVDSLQLNADLTGASTLTVNGTFDWNNGTISAPLLITNAGVINVATLGSHLFDGASVQNSGAINLVDNDVLLDNGANVTNSGTISIAGDHDFAWNAIGATPSIYNSGTITKAGGAGVSLLGGGASLTTIDTISASSGTLQITSSVVTNNPPSGRIRTMAAFPKYFQVSNGATIQFSAGATFIDGTDFSGTGTILISSAATFSGTITGAIPTSLVLDANATFTFSTAIFDGAFVVWKQGLLTGDLTTTSTATISVQTSAGSRRTANFAFTSNGAFKLYTAGCTLSDLTTFTNNLVIDFQGDHTISFDGIGGTPGISGSGSIVKSAGGGMAVIDNGVSLNSANILQSQSGTLRIASPATVTGTVDAQSAGTMVEFNGGPVFGTGTSFSGAGMILVNSGATFNGSLSQGATLARIDTTSTVTWNGASINGNMEWKDANMTGTGLVIAGGSVITVITGNVTLDALPLTNNGSLLLASASVALANGASVDNQGVIDLQGDFDFRWNGAGAAPSVTNSGSLQKSAGNGTSTVNCGGVCTNAAAGTLTAVTGLMAVTSGLTSSGTITFPLNGPTPLVDFGRIAVSGGTLTLGGVATASVGYSPDGGTAFQVMTFTARSGDFATKNYTFAGVRTLADTYTASDLTLVASGPTIATLSPVAGNTAGGTSVTITGTGFAGTTGGEAFTGSVTFGASPAASATWQSSTQIVATTAAAPAGTVNVTVTNANGEAHTKLSAYTFAAPTTVTSIANGNWSSPSTWDTNTVPTSADTVVIDGETVVVDVSVTVAAFTLSAGSVTGSPNSITVTGAFNWTGGDIGAPLTLNGTGTISGAAARNVMANVTNAGTVTSTATGQITLYSGNFTNDGTFNLQGDGPWARFNPTSFTNGSTGIFNKTAGTGTSTWNVDFVNQGTMDISSGSMAFAMSHTAGTGSHYKFGVSGAAAAGSMTFATAPTLTSAMLTAYVVGPFVPQGGQSWTLMSPISGTFGTTTTTFGSGRSFAVSYPGGTSVVVTASGPTITAISPNNGSELGGTTVTLTGTGFASLPTVTFGLVNATSVTFDSTTQLTVVTPAHAPGTFDVVVTNPDGQPTTAVGGYTYTAAGAAVSIAKTAPASVSASQLFTYTISVVNGGPDPATSVTVTDVVQAGMTASNVVAPSFTCSGTTTLTCTAASLAAGTHTITFDVTAPGSPQAITNVANLSAANDSTPGDNSASAVTNVGSASADLAVTTAAGSPSVAVGSTMTWTTTVTNNGPSNASSIVITDTVPAGQTITSATAGCTIAGSTVTCTVPTLANGASTSIAVTVTADEGGTRMNQATATATEPDGNGTNDVGTATVSVTGDTILVVTNNNPAGTGSLEQAILDANSGLCSPCTIQFNIPGLPTIAAALPFVTASNVLIDGTTQPGYAAGSPVIALDGTAQNPGTHGLVLQGAGAMVRGLSIFGYTDAIRVAGSNASILDNVLFSNTDGVSVVTATGARILGNSIYSNSGLPIDHDADGITQPLDAGDGDTGSNNYQNAPVISLAEIAPGGLDVTFSVDSSAVIGTQSLYVEVFKTDGAGEPQTLLGGQCFAGNNLVNQVLTVPVGSVVPGNSIVATATSYVATGCSVVGDGTSEVSAAVVAGSCVPPAVAITGPTTSCAGTNIVLDAGTGYATYLWSPGGQTTQTITVAPTATTTYSVSVTDGSGCANSATHVVTVNTAAPVAITGPSASCGTAITLTATAGFASYLWQPGNLTGQSVTVTPTASTTYTLTATDGNGCTSSTTHAVTFNPPTPASITPGGPTTFCTGGSVTLTATAGNAYLWSPGGETTQSITVTASGTYGVAVTDGNGCVTNATPVLVTVNTPAPVTVTGPGTSCPSATVTLTATAGFTSYLWQPGNLTGQVINVSPASTTTYTVTATDGNGCTSSTTHTVTVSAAPVVAISGAANSCAGSPVTLTADAGFTSYLWSPGGETTQSITVTPGAPSTTYSVTATAAGGCTATASHTVIVTTPTPATATASGPTTFCAGGAVVLNASAGASYQWLPGGETTQSITVTASGTYSVIVTDAGGCISTSNSIPVTVNAAPSVTITGPTATCASTPVTLDAGPGASYLWTPGNFNTQTITVAPPVTTTYSVTVTDANGCTGSDTHAVTVTSSPVATIAAPAAVCAGATGINASVGITPGATYTWSIVNGQITAGNGTSSITWQPSSTSPVQLDVTVAAGSCTATGSATVNVSPAPLTPAITAPSSVPASTAGHTASITAEAGVTYTWSIAGGTIDGANTGASISFSAGTTTPIILTVDANKNGCLVSSSATVTVTSVTPPPALEADLGVTKSAPASVVAGSTFSYTINVTNGGPATAVNVALADVLPAGVTVAGFNAGLWSCGTSAGQFNCSIPSLAPGAFDVITLSVVAPSQAGTIVNSVSVSSAIADPDSANDSDSASTNVVLASPGCPAAPPALVSPADGTIGITSPVTLSWTAVSGATTYDVWISTDGALALAGSTQATSLTVNVGSGTTTWYVVAHGGTGCTSTTSQTRSFTVAPSTTCGTHGKPQITAPAQPVVSSPVTISWTPVPQAIGYRVWMTVDGTALQDIGTTDGAITLTVDVPAGAIVVFVDALFNGCPPTRSDGVSFQVPQPDPCSGRGAASLLSPANNSLVNASSVELTWSAAPPLNGIPPQYRVWGAVDGAAPEVHGTTADLSLRTVFPRGQVVWFVETLYPGCASTQSQRFNFTIPPRNECGTARPDLIAPSGTTVTSANVTFAWSAVSDAIGYEVYLSLGNETPALIGTVGAGTTSLAYLVPPGDLTWFVRALIDRCPPRDSVGARFTYAPPPACQNNERPVAIAPLEGPAVTSPLDFFWSAPAGANRYELYVQRAGQAPVLVASTNVPEARGVALTAGTHHWFVRAFFANCSPLDSAAQEITIVTPPAACADLRPPVISAPGQISSGVEFLVQWSPSAGASSYQLQVASSESFANAETITTTATQHALVRTNNNSAPMGVYARVRAIDSRCEPPTVTAYGPVSAIFVLPEQGTAGAAPLTSDEPLSYTIPLGSQFAGQTFTAVPNQSWLKVTPSSGVVPAAGLQLLVTADTTGLPVGTSLGAVTVTLSSPSARIGTNGVTSVTSTVSVNLVTPVTPAPKNTPPPDALIIPAVANADGINSHFQSDVRVSNTSPQLIKYQLTFTPTGEAGIASGRQTTFSIEPGRTVALDDILKSWFGTGAASATGTLEVRPLTQTATTTSSAAVGALANLVTFASSRTFNVTPNGTFGQHIPAIPFANFVGKAGNAVLSLQQISQSAKYRTNLGLVEGSGEPATLMVKVFGTSGTQLTQFPVALNGGQHVQLNGVLAQNGVSDLNDGRIEVQVVSGNGKVTAYASVLDNATADPLLVSPVTLSESGNTKWVVPGVADLDNGAANWQTDMRVFNAGTADVTATLTFYSQNGGQPKTAEVTIPAGQVRTFDRTLSSVFGASNDGGAVHISTPADARLIATARTYNLTTGGGTYGQFISAVTPAEAAGVGTRPLQLLQVEESSRFRSNIGLAEVTGNPVKLEISVVPPDAKFTAVAQVQLAANEFRQIGSLLRSVGLSETYNARVTVRAVEGTGRVAAYASVVDMVTNDPTYVPAQ